MAQLQLLSKQCHAVFNSWLRCSDLAHHHSVEASRLKSLSTATTCWTFQHVLKPGTTEQKSASGFRLYSRCFKHAYRYAPGKKGQAYLLDTVCYGDRYTTLRQSFTFSLSPPLSPAVSRVSSTPCSFNSLGSVFHPVLSLRLHCLHFLLFSSLPVDVSGPPLSSSLLSLLSTVSPSPSFF